MENLKTIYQPKSLAKIAYDKLRQSILSGEFKAGELYNEMALAKEMGISRTPVREALLELANNGLIQFLPRRGVVVTLLSEKDLEELFELREVLEKHFFLKIASSPEAFDLSILTEILEAQKTAALKQCIPEYLKANSQFHHALAKMCKNKRMLDNYGTLVDQIRLLALQGMGNPMRMNHLISQHEAMIEALETGDVDLSIALLTIHLKESRLAALKGIQKYEKTK